MVLKIKEQVERFEEFIADIIYDRGKGINRLLFGWVLKGLSVIFSGVVRLRSLLYKKRILKSRSLGCVVVVVGNLTVGGTGKTPIVEKLARSFTEKGRKVAILSRGYKSKGNGLWKQFWMWLTHGDVTAPKVVSDGEKVLLDSEVAGDEPYMLARNLPGVVVLVDKDRVKAGHYAIQRFGVDTLILDDGFQYLRLKGRMNVLLVDKTNPFGNESLLPRGILREPIKHLKRASYVFLTKSDGSKDKALEERIRKHHGEVEIIECCHKPRYLESIFTGERLPLEALKGARVGAFSGIASPEGFENLLRKMGAELALRRRYVDHHRFTEEELNSFFKRAANVGVKKVITTEKDAVRLPKMIETSGLEVCFLRLEIEIVRGEEDFDKGVASLCFPITRMKATRPVELTTVNL